MGVRTSADGDATGVFVARRREQNHRNFGVVGSGSIEDIKAAKVFDTALVGHFEVREDTDDVRIDECLLGGSDICRRLDMLPFERSPERCLHPVDSVRTLDEEQRPSRDCHLSADRCDASNLMLSAAAHSFMTLWAVGTDSLTMVRQSVLEEDPP